MNICIFGNSFLPAVGGKEYVMHNLGNALVELGHNVVIVAKRVSWCAPSEKKSYQLKLYSIPVKGSGKSGLDLFSAILTMVVQNSKNSIEVMNCHGVDYPGTMARHIKSLFKFPLVMTPHGMDVQKIQNIGYGLRLDDKWDRIISRNLQVADYVTAISQSIHGDLDMVSEERIVDIPNGIHINRFSSPKSEFLHEHLGIPAIRQIILSVGRNHIKKGYDYGIQAVSKLVREIGYKDIHYVIVGRDVTRHKKMVTECQAETFVSLIDEISSEMITQCYKSADIFFSPSIVEGLSLVSIEAMAAGLPLVVTNVPGNDDVVKENSCGVIVRSEDVEDMANGLNRLASNEAYKKSLAMKSKESAVKYDWLQIASRYVDVYIKAIQQKQDSYQQSFRE